MAGVLVEIDAVLSAQSLARLGADLEKTTASIGTGIAAGAGPAALSFSRQLINTLQTRFKQESGVLAKQLADGTLNIAQYSAAATRLGKDIIRDLNRGIKSGGKLELFGGDAGLALRNQLQGVGVAATRAAPAIQNVGVVAQRATPGINAIRGAVVSLTATAAGVPGPLGRIVSTLLLLGGGGGAALAAAAVIGTLALGINFLTKAAREGRKATDDLLESLKNLGKSEFELLSSKIDDVNKQLRDTEKRIRDIRDLRAAAGPRTGVGGVPFVIDDKQLKDELKRLDDLRDKLRLLRSEQAGLGTSTVTFGGQRITTTTESTGLRNVTEETAEQERKREEAHRREIQRRKEITQLLEEEARRQLQIDEDQRQISEEAQQALAEVTTTTIDELQLQIAAFETRVLAAFGHITPEAQKVIDSWKERLENTRLLESVDQELEALGEKSSSIALLGGRGPAAMDMLGTLDEMVARLTAARDKLDEGSVLWKEWDDRIQSVVGMQAQLLTDIGDASVGTEALGRNWEKIGDTIATVGQGLLDMARGMGMVGEETEKVLQGIISIGANLPKALAGDPGAILGVVGGAVSAIGGAFFNPNKDPQRLAQNQAWYEAAIGGDANALEQLRVHSVVSQQGRPGWGSGRAAADAANKYQAAKKALASRAESEANSPEAIAAREAEKTRAADQAERERIDRIRETEERQVAERAQRDELASEEALKKRAEPLGDAIMAQVTAAIAESRAADAIAAQSELGEDSPLARDARRRADEKIRDAERAIEEAEREKEKITGGKVTAGFTVQRTITETSAGRLIGELTTISTHTSWLPKIYELMAGGRPGGPGTGGGTPPFVIENHTTLEMDSEVVARKVSRHQLVDYQEAAGRQGNVGM